MTEIALSGGRMKHGVVRVGQTVRRPSGTNSDFVRSLLGHLETAGFDGAPRSLGTDRRGRDILSYIEGQVPTELGFYDDDALVAAAKLIHRYHDATVSLLDTAAADEVQIEVVCHNDLSPCNFVFRNGLPTAIIDFDAAAPGSRYCDMGYAAWLWLDLGNSEIDAVLQRRRLQVFVDGYGGGLSERAVVEAIMARQGVLIAEGRRIGRDAMVRWATDCLGWTSDHLWSPKS